jgi:hypothetical protein
VLLEQLRRERESPPAMRRPPTAPKPPDATGPSPRDFDSYFKS